MLTHTHNATFYKYDNLFLRLRVAISIRGVKGKIKIRFSLKVWDRKVWNKGWNTSKRNRKLISIGSGGVMEGLKELSNGSWRREQIESPACPFNKLLLWVYKKPPRWGSPSLTDSMSGSRCCPSQTTVIPPLPTTQYGNRLQTPTSRLPGCRVIVRVRKSNFSL